MPMRTTVTALAMVIMACVVGWTGVAHAQCATGYRLTNGECVDVDECVESYDSQVFSTLASYHAELTARGLTPTGIETFDNLGPGGAASSNSLGVTLSPTLGAVFEPLWSNLVQQPVTFQVASCGGTNSSGVFSMLNNNICSTSWAGPAGPPIGLHLADPDMAIVGAGVFNASGDDVLVMRFYGDDGTLLVSATIPAGQPAFVGVVAQVPATRITIGPAPGNPGNGLIAFDNLELATRPRGHVGGELCGADATCVNTPGGYQCVTDDCPSDPLKDHAGVCGCGQPEADANGDGTVDCGFGLCDRAHPLSEPVACGAVGLCQSIMGTRRCDVMTGVVSDDCDQLVPEDLSETCDGTDDDCDGSVDEGFDPTCGAPGEDLFYAVVSDAQGVPVGTIRCHATSGALDCDRDPNDQDILMVYPEQVCPAP